MFQTLTIRFKLCRKQDWIFLNAIVIVQMSLWVEVKLIGWSLPELQNASRDGGQETFLVADDGWVVMEAWSSSSGCGCRVLVCVVGFLVYLLNLLADTRMARKQFLYIVGEFSIIVAK